MLSTIAFQKAVGFTSLRSCQLVLGWLVKCVPEDAALIWCSSRSASILVFLCRLLVAGHKPGDAPGCAGGFVVLSGRLSDVRGFNDFLQDFLVQVGVNDWVCGS